MPKDPNEKRRKEFQVKPGGPAPVPRRGSLAIAGLTIALVLPSACVVFGMARLVTLLFTTRIAANEANRSAECARNLKRIGIALQNYADEYRRFPPAYVADASGKAAP